MVTFLTSHWCLSSTGYRFGQNLSHVGTPVERLVALPTECSGMIPAHNHTIAQQPEIKHGKINTVKHITRTCIHKYKKIYNDRSGIRTHTTEVTDALNQHLRLLSHPAFKQYVKIISQWLSNFNRGNYYWQVHQENFTLHALFTQYQGSNEQRCLIFEYLADF